MEEIRAEHLKELVRDFAHIHVAVVGDLMLDTYTWGRASRLSPEAPVPVVQSLQTTSCLGGAGNVMRNIVSLGGTALAFGITGQDSSAEELRSQLASCGIRQEGVLMDPGRPTICKQRIIAGSQQLLRLDYEDPTPISDALRRELYEKVKNCLQENEVHALVLEDYAKGLFSQEFAQKLVDLAVEKGIPAILDPNPKNPMRLKNLTLMKPNRAEAYDFAAMPNPPGAARMEELQKVAEKIRKEWQVKYLLISLAEQGMALFMPEGEMHHIPTRAKEVFDVSGAGDTVIAASTLALCTAPGEPASAAELANFAAGIVVGKLGTAAVTSAELCDSFH